ncbi:fasciclin-like arabinogalactan protein 12 [Malania oleifera]|uniref:fasciclin-like arabinogalactan protein 12 n=1 Tax=Malania oleifera TaxID=397392 RepID=UPI0025AE8D0E|nr:fasciclin-like arabinogalactan protein 12 [Malania oleifera]
MQHYRNMANPHLLSSFSILLLALLHSSTTPAQSQAPSPAPVVSSPPPLAPLAPAPLSLVPISPVPSSDSTNITAILEKAGTFNSLIRILKTTQVDDRISTLLSDSSNGLTLFAPTDKAFSNLKTGLLNSLTDQQQVQLVLYHILTSYFPPSQFEAASNPLNTQAGDTANGEYPLNVSTASKQVSLRTGLVNTTVAKTIYTDGQLAVYQVDDVLLPMRIFTPLPPAPAPSKHKKPVGGASGSADGSLAERSEAGAATWHFLVWLGGALLLAAISL